LFAKSSQLLAKSFRLTACAAIVGALFFALAWAPDWLTDRDGQVIVLIGLIAIVGGLTASSWWALAIVPVAWLAAVEIYRETFVWFTGREYGSYESPGPVWTVVIAILLTTPGTVAGILLAYLLKKRLQR
jgi:hypothetical protein